MNALIALVEVPNAFSQERSSWAIKRLSVWCLLGGLTGWRFGACKGFRGGALRVLLCGQRGVEDREEACLVQNDTCQTYTTVPSGERHRLQLQILRELEGSTGPPVGL